MRRLILAAIVGLTAVLVVGGYAWWQTDEGKALKGSGTVVTEPREVSGFSTIDLQGVGVLRITQGTVETLTVRTDDNILPLITTEVRDGTLRIAIDTTEHRHGIDPTDLTYDVSVTSLQALSVAGAARVETGPLATEDLRFDVDGAARISVDGLQAQNLHVASAGGSVFVFTGVVDTQEVIIDGTADYQARQLTSRSATVEIDGAGHVVVRVSESLDAEIDGSGVVEYIGQPAVVQHVNGVGTVHQVET
jgi:hypothetical protein